MMIHLRGRRALVTGGSRGIGYAIAAAFVQAGAEVVIASRSEQAGQQAARELGVHWLRGDVSQEAEARPLVRRAIERLGGLNILVNNAGQTVRKLALDVSDQDWDRLLAVNVKGVFFCAVEAARHMKEHGGGKVISISSVGARLAAHGRVVYGSTKAAVGQMTRVMAVEWAPFNIQVNAIAPGWVRTEFNADYLDADPERLREIIKSIPAGRIGTPEDIAGLAVFLGSDASTYMTGQVLEIDGGIGLQ